MHNHHVYVYFRFKAWVAGETGKYMRQWFMNEFAAQELNAQHKNCPAHEVCGDLGENLTPSQEARSKY